MMMREYDLADLGERLAAQMIDSILTVVSVIILVAFPSISSEAISEII